MNPLLAALVQLGILSQADAERMGRQMDPATQRTYAEQQLSAAFVRGLTAQQSRLVDLLRKADGRPSAREINNYWTQEDAALWEAVQPTIVQIATEAAVTPSIAHGENTWNLVNESVMGWVDRYYTSPSAAFVGSIPNLNDTSRQQFANVFTDWQRGTLPETGYERGLPQLIKALEPIFGEGRATRIGVTETTRVFSEGEVAAARADEFIEYLEAFSSQDELVCPTCGPVAGQVIPKDADGFEHPEEGNIGFPPYHVNCRCWVSPAVRPVSETNTTQEQTTQESQAPAKPKFTPEQVPTFTSVKDAQAWMSKNIANDVALPKAANVSGLQEIAQSVSNVQQRFGVGPLRYMGDPKKDVYKWKSGPNDIASVGSRRGVGDALLFSKRATEADTIANGMSISNQLAAARSDSYSVRKTLSAGMANGKVDEAAYAIARGIDKERWSVVEDIRDAFNHEMGHYVSLAHPEKDALMAISKKAYDRGWAPLISNYGKSNVDEFLAESFTLYMRGDTERLHPDLLEWFTKHDKAAQ